MAVAPLADEPGVALFIHGEDADGAVFVVDDAVDAFSAGGVDDLVLAYSDPRVGVGLAGGERFPGIRLGGEFSAQMG